MVQLQAACARNLERAHPQPADRFRDPEPDRIAYGALLVHANY